MSLSAITSTDALRDLCADYANSPYVTVDTEFMRERTYWPILCLVQIGRPRREGETDEDFERDGAVLIDPMAEGIDLAPLFGLMADRSVLKVFHAARQDIEIFVNLADAVPVPLFDTQIAAMVCGFGDQVGYEKLVRTICGKGLDKSSRFTDWSRRPLSEKQLVYALADVTHLRDVYEHLSERLEKENRSHWLTEEMAVLEAVETYKIDPSEAWKRLKMRAPTGKLFMVAKALAEWREAEAQARNVPRNRVLRDDALMELAASRPTTIEGLTSGRLSRRENFSNASVAAMLDTITAATKAEPEKPPKAPPKPDAVQSALADLLRTLLRARTAGASVADRLVASSSDLEAIAMEEEPDVPALRGWRRDLFGEFALKLKRGEVALSAGPKGVEVIELGPRDSA